MNANFAKPDETPKVGQHVFCTLDGKSQAWATIATVYSDGTLDLNVHDNTGVIVGGIQKAPKGALASPKTWWV